jgi:hypothetical protein
MLVLFECGHVQSAVEQKLEEENPVHYFQVRLPKSRERCGACDGLTDYRCTIADTLEFCVKSYDLSANQNFLRDRMSLWRWQIDIVCLEAILEAFEEQKRECLHWLIYENHYHNAKQYRGSKLEEIRKASQKADHDQDMEKLKGKRILVELDFAEDEGSYIGRAWADLVKKINERDVTASQSSEEAESTMMRVAEETETVVFQKTSMRVTPSKKKTKSVEPQPNRVQKRTEKEKVKCATASTSAHPSEHTGSLRDLIPLKFNGSFSNAPKIGDQKAVDVIAM